MEVYLCTPSWEESLWSDVDNPSAKYGEGRGPQDRQEECQTEKQQRREGQAVLKSKNIITSQ